MATTVVSIYYSSMAEIGNQLGKPRGALKAPKAGSTGESGSGLVILFYRLKLAERDEAKLDFITMFHCPYWGCCYET